MLEDGNTGVTTGDSAAPAGSESPVVPQTTSVEVNSDPQATVDSSAPPAAADEIPENDDDLASLPETERTPLINQRNRIRELNKWRTGAEPVMSWVEERGGMEYVRQDAELVDKFYSSNVEDREQFYTALRQDSAAFERFMTDVTTDPTVQRRTLQAMNPQAVLDYVQQAGLLGDDYSSNVDPSVRATIPAELQGAWDALPAEAKEAYAQMAPGVRNWNLQRDAQLHQIQQADKQSRQQARQEAIHNHKAKVYSDVRSIVQSALAEKLPGSDEAVGFVLHATEAALAQSPEGIALWNEIDSLIENGQARELRQKLPLIIAKAKSIATEKAKWLNDRESKARQFDELMRMGESVEDIMKYLNQVRGGQRQPGQGTTPQPTNGHVPKPDALGQFDRANILSYHPAHRQ